MKIVNYKIKGYKELASVIELKEGEEWTLSLNNPEGYRIDGYYLTNKGYLQYKKLQADSTMLYHVLSLKCEEQNDNQLIENAPLDDTVKLFSWLREQPRLYGFVFQNNGGFRVGRIAQVTPNYFTILPVDSDLDPCRERKLSYSKVRYIMFGTDYLHSLELLETNKKILKGDGIHFVPKVSMGPFRLFDNIKDYLNRGYRYSVNKKEKRYHFHDFDISVYVNYKNVINCIDTDVECIWEGQNIIDMKINDFLQKFHLKPDKKKERNEMASGPEYVYEFDVYGIMIWTRSGRICTIQAFNDDNL